MIVLVGLAVGAVFGALLARKRGGRGLDMLQYGAGYAIMFGLICLFISIILSRLMAA